MSERTQRLRQESLAAIPHITGERAATVTAFYQENYGKHSMPVLRGLNFLKIVEDKVLYLGDGELIVGERGPEPKAVPTFPELTCHSAEDLRILDVRPLTAYKVDPSVIDLYERDIVPYWKDRSMRDVMFKELPREWIDCYEAGCYTEFMEQRSPGHTVADGKIYRKGLLDFKADIDAAIAALDFHDDPEALDKREELRGMALSCDAVILWAKRYSDQAAAKARVCQDPARRVELEKIADVCAHVPAHAPRDFQEALQYYWFCHLAVITELNGWDAFSPGHLDQHLWPFYEKGLADGTLTRESAKELVECFFIKFNNHTAPAKQGVTAAESGTYTDFANINLAGLLKDGSDGSNEVTHLLLDVIDEFHLLQPSSNMQVSRKTPDAVLKHCLRVNRNGYGFPSIFNADAVVEEQLRQGKTFEDAREGGTSGCVEVGAFGKEAYILTGYFNLMKILELTLHGGFDARTGKQVGARTGDPATFKTFDDLFAAFQAQFLHVLDIKVRGNLLIERLYATRMPHTFLSVLTDDCIKKGKDYNAGGARYNNTFIQAVGIGSISDSLSALKEVVFEKQEISLQRFIQVLDSDFEGMEPLRQRLVNKTHKYGNDDDYVDGLMLRTFNMLFEAIDGIPNGKGGVHRVEMLPTTCHVYFGEVCGASPDGRRKGVPLSEGISPVQGADREGPTAVIKSAAKMDHVKTGGTLLNMKFSPSLLEGEKGIDNLHSLVRSYFKMDGHHMQFNVVGAGKLREAQEKPEQFRDLIVRVAGYSDYFCDLSRALQDEIIQRTEHAAF
jgi:formate C-acetyltransferase